ncbi:MAG: GWxTD domain-containing protein [Ignavibacteria bacterium]|jgi:GWxTD domain-containing protein|nr:GWxTD domain-containing protein [Ignavibacteria bacterium]
MKRIIFILFVFLGITSNLYAQIEVEKENFYLDAIVFKGDKIDSARIDLFCVIPNDILTFLRSNTTNDYRSKYTLLITILDENNRSMVAKKHEKTIQEIDFKATQGGNAEFSKIQEQYFLPKGNYQIHAVLTDIFSKNEYEKKRNISVIPFNDFPISTSGILFLSEIEEKNGKFLITPHLSDNIGIIENGFFAFFELYNNMEEKTITVLSEVINQSSDDIIYSAETTKDITKGTNQIFIRFNKNINYSSNKNILRITIKDNEKKIAASQRSIKNQSYLFNKITNNLDDAIRQLRYVATALEINHINEAQNEEERLKRFEQFWYKLDPTPQTKRNEALEEYYYRVAYANKNFKSYTEGWMTDKGNVFIVYGPPNAVERSNNSYSSSKIYEKWTYYSNNRIFLFYDSTGFGDFRLSNPTHVSEKYKYSAQ